MGQTLCQALYVNQCKTDFHKMLRLDRNRYRGGVILYINEKIPCKNFV